MRIAIDTHAHTIASGHAYCTLKEMVQMAADKKLDAIAITEHAPNMPGVCQLYYFQNMRVIPRNMCGIEVLLGTELNILNKEGDVDLPASVIRELDISIASMHTPCFHDEPTIENVTEGYVNVMRQDYVDIIGHPDDSRFPVDYELLVKEAAVTGTLLELNNSSLRPGGFRQNTRENAKKLLNCCKEQGALILLGSDAHMDVDIAEYQYAMEVIEEVRFPEDLIANTSLEKLKASLKRNKKL